MNHCAHCLNWAKQQYRYSRKLLLMRRLDFCLGDIEYYSDLIKFYYYNSSLPEDFK